MARPPRIEFSGAHYVVTARTLPRQRLFRDDLELADFLGRIPQLVDALGAVVHGYCVLPNQYHLLLETPRGNLSRIVHRLHAGYTATVNARRRRRGPLLQSRYRAVLLEPDPWLLRLSVWIHRNPLRKKLAPDPWHYPGSSAGGFRAGAPPVPGLTTERILALAGGAAAYQKRVETPGEDGGSPWRHVWRQVVLGGEALRARVLAEVKSRDSREIPEFSPKSEGPDLDAIVAVVSDNTGLSPAAVLRGKYQRSVARKVAMYLARRHSDLTLREIGDRFGVDYTTVHMAARRVEELRCEDAGLAEFLEVLEAELTGGPETGVSASPQETARVEAPPVAAEPDPESSGRQGEDEPPAAPDAAEAPRRRRRRKGSSQLDLF